MNRRLIKIIVPVLILIELSCIFLACMSYSNKNVEEVIESNQVDKEQFAMYVENSSGTYDIYSESVFPTGYALNEEKSVCVNLDGEEIPGILSYSAGNLTMTSNKTAYCYLYFDIEGTAFAIYSETDNSLRFYKNDDEVTVGDTYNDLVVTNIYAGIEETNYSSYQDVPWYDYNGTVTKVVVENKISPISICDWFSQFYNVESIDVTKLDTSNVTNMSGLLGRVENNGEETVIVGMESWDTSKVIDMSNMFDGAIISYIDLSGWNTSNVEDMSWMFNHFAYLSDISGWNTSSVTDMSNMFSYSITGFTASEPLDLSKWDVSNVTSHTNFDYSISPEGSIIAPDFNS